MSRSDDELLEFAAKAYGIDWENVLRDGGVFVENGRRWYPLVDDGDALRLLVKLKMDINIENDEVTIWYYAGYADVETISESPVNGDFLAATCRAIVRAAAEIGKTL